jgi:hypothetical protein
VEITPASLKAGFEVLTISKARTVSRTVLTEKGGAILSKSLANTYAVGAKADLA